MSTKQKQIEKFIKNNIGTIVAIISTIIAGFSLYQSGQSLKLAEEALHPKIIVEYLFSSKDFSNQVNKLCYQWEQINGETIKLGGPSWKTEFILGIDVSNIGGQSISLVKILGGEFESNADEIIIGVNYKPFNTQPELEEWLANHHRFFQINPGENYEFFKMPLKIEVGETKRLIMHGLEYVEVISSANQTKTVKALTTIRWISDLTFIFADGTKKILSIPIDGPYGLSNGSLPPDIAILPAEFEFCTVSNSVQP